MAPNPQRDLRQWIKRISPAKACRSQKDKGDEVYAGSINGEAALEMRVSRLSADNTLSRIIELLQSAQSRRAPSQRLIDRFAHVYTPAVALTAVAVALVPPLLFRRQFLGYGGGARLAVSRAGDARHCLPLRAGDQHAGDGDQRVDRGGAPRRFDQGRRGFGNARWSESRRLRQNRDLDARANQGHGDSYR